MPTLTFTASLADTAQAYHTQHGGPSNDNVRYDLNNGQVFRMYDMTNVYYYASVLIFNVSGIVQGTTITSAYLKLYGGYTWGQNKITFSVSDASDPAMPVSANFVLNHSNVLATKKNLATGAAWVNNVNDQQNIAQYVLKDIEVTTMVNTLVASYDYTAAANMLFMANVPQPSPSGPPNQNVIWLGEGGGEESYYPQLEITYEGTLVDKTVYNFK